MVSRYGVSQLARMFKLSRTAIYNNIDRHLQQYILSDNHGQYLDEEGLDQLRIILTPKDINNNEGNNISNRVGIDYSKDNNNIDIDFYKKEIENLHIQINNLHSQFNNVCNQLVEKDKQISKLTDQIDNTHRLLENSQVLLREANKGFWRKLLNR